MDITVRKASPATIQMIGENGDSINVTEEVISTIEDTTVKTDELITKQSVLDVFNKQFLERLNLIPKYSKDYFYILTGDPETTRNTDVHGSFFNSLGWNFANSDYGLMTMHDYIRLDQFQDQEGDITFDDLLGTFTQAIQNASRLAKYKITIMKGSRKYSEKDIYATLSNGNPNMIDFNTVKNSILGTTEFNTICKRWYQRVLDHAEETQQRKEYVYRLPDPPPPAQGGVKYFKKEKHLGRVDLRMNGRENTNTAEFDIIFATGESTVHFLIPKVTRNIRGFKLRKQYRIRVQGLYITSMLIHKDTGVILAQTPEREVHSGDHEDIFLFPNERITVSDHPSDDMILRLYIRTTGDPGDGMAVVLELTEIIYNDDYDVYPALSRRVPSVQEINNEIQGPEHYYVNKVSIPATKYRYTVKDFVFKPVYFVTLLTGHGGSRYLLDGIEVYRDGVFIGKSLSYRCLDENKNIDLYYTTKYGRRELSSWAEHMLRISRYSRNWSHDTDVFLINDISNIDIRNGDTLVFKFQFADYYNSNRNIALNNIISRNSIFRIEDIYCSHQLIG